MEPNKFLYRKSGGYILECESCGHGAPLIQCDRDSVQARGEKRWICEICHCSMVGVVTDYKSRSDDVRLYKTMAEIANIILDKTTDRRQAIDLAVEADSDT